MLIILRGQIVTQDDLIVQQCFNISQTKPQKLSVGSDKKKPLPFLSKGLCYISNGFIHHIHHGRISSPIPIFDEAVFVQVFFRCLNWVVDILKCHI